MIYKAIDLWNSPSLEHHGVKGMKWGVRHDNRSLGQRYSDWGRRSSNKYYDKQIAKIEARRKKRTNEISTSPIKNTRYGKWVQKTSNKNYDRERAYIESRRQRRTQEFDNFDKMRAGVSNFGKKSVQFVKDHKKEIAIGTAVAVGAAAAVAIAKDPGFTVKQVPVMYTRLNPNSHLGKAMKTPVAFITKGKSTIRSNVYRRGAVNRNNADFVNWQRRTAKSAMNNMYATPAQNAAARNAYLHYGGEGGTYRPRYVTNKGGAVSKRLERWNGKTRVLRRTNSWS